MSQPPCPKSVSRQPGERIRNGDWFLGTDNQWFRLGPESPFKMAIGQTVRKVGVFFPDALQEIDRALSKLQEAQLGETEEDYYIRAARSGLITPKERDKLIESKK